MTRAATLFLLVASTLPAAPAPRYRPQPPPGVTPGEYVARWAGTEYRITFHANYTHTEIYAGTTWRGTWHWDAKTRTLRVAESPAVGAWSGDPVLRWEAVLSDRLEGEARYGEGATVVVGLRRVTSR